jgi:putative spermidine/putrescine transport system substrate-binding protein
MNIRRVIAVAVCGAVAATGFVACGSETSDSAGSSTSSGAPPVPATKPDRLVIRIWSGDEQQVYADTAAKAFTEATGIPIVWDTTDEAVSYAKLN